MGLALKLGFTGFGGGYAVAQQIRRAVVDERKWLDDQAFIEALAVASSLPGTTATNLLTLIGYRFGGVRAAAGAAVAFLRRAWRSWSRLVPRTGACAISRRSRLSSTAWA